MTDSSSYICDPLACPVHENYGKGGNGAGVCWHEETWYRLKWQYGESRANTIVMGLDARTEADRASWRRLGE